VEYSNRTSSETVCQMKCWSGQLITLNDLAAEGIRISPLWIAECRIEAKNIKLQILKISFRNSHPAICIEEELIHHGENERKLW
jgi:hypothetical protein